MENPYQPPTELDLLVRVVRFPKTSRLRFLYVVSLILSLALVVTVFVVQNNDLSYLGGFAFFGLVASGPLMTLAFFRLGHRRLGSPNLERFDHCFCDYVNISLQAQQFHFCCFSAWRSGLGVDPFHPCCDSS